MCLIAGGDAHGEMIEEYGGSHRVYQNRVKLREVKHTFNFIGEANSRYHLLLNRKHQKKDPHSEMGLASVIHSSLNTAWTKDVVWALIRQ